jgi:hypothetical protein
MSDDQEKPAALPPRWVEEVEKIARRVFATLASAALTPEQRAEIVAIVESAEVQRADGEPFIEHKPLVLRVPRSEETSDATGSLGVPLPSNPPTTCTPAARSEEAGPPQGEDEAMRIALDSHLPAHVTADRIRAYGDARVREALAGVLKPLPPEPPENDDPGKDYGI